ncbi:hypothetical protein [Sporisorium scitamineum]|uniref:Uncharacterized protein n=1 Tax=Sporisorium scitamineum TaxID=49012 RepID=A0A0F7S2U2_9BASI|nr:hypothetical protein [Sporisorium scitamineum]
MLPEEQLKPSFDGSDLRLFPAQKEQILQKSLGGLEVKFVTFKHC